MNVADIMTRTVISVTPETTIAEAARLLLHHRISGLPVVDPAGAVVGIVTEGDLLRRTETGTERRHARWLEFLLSPGRLAEDYAHANARNVGEVMSMDVVAVGPQDPLAEVVQLMERRHIKRLPVIESGRLVGIVSRANLVRALLDDLTKPAGGKAATGDAEIRERILAEIARQPWGPRASVDVRVEAGIVELYGTITDERERAALQVLAENTSGVTAVRDHLVWVEPVSGLVIPAVGSEPPAND
ncbi:MAG TPA: CBS domain-containing protein [Stellaceae bacterium]|nr:CBS domain-containing protein [Stellaceae bacterium]